MAIKYKFTCIQSDTDFLEVLTTEDNEHITLGGEYRLDTDSGFRTVDLSFTLDLTTAIKLAKTLRTEINKAKEGGQDENN